MILFSSYLLLLFTAEWTLVLSDLTVRPEDVTAFTRDMVTFKCSTSSVHGVQWMCEGNCSSTPGTQRILFLHGKLMEPQNKRVEVNTSVIGQYDLVISSVSESDAGTYSCLDLDEPEFIASAMLLVKSVTIMSTPVFSESQATTDSDNKPGSAFVVVVVVVITIAVIVIVIIIAVYFCQRKQVCCFARNQKSTAERTEDSPDSANNNAQETKTFLDHPPDTADRQDSTRNDTLYEEVFAGSLLNTSDAEHEHHHLYTSISSDTSQLSYQCDELKMTTICYAEFLRFAKNQKLYDNIELTDTTILSDEQKTGISKNLEQLTSTLCNSLLFMNDLVAFGCVSSDDGRSILDERDDNKKCLKLVANITENAGKMRIFKKCLVKHGHKEAARMLPPFDELHLSLCDKIQHYRPLLRYILEPRFGFRKRLRELNIMTKNEIYIGGHITSSIYEQSDHLLESLRHKSDDDCNRFLQVMSETHQQHLVSVIKETRESKDNTKHQRPLGYAELNMLIGDSRQKLIDSIHPGIGFLDMLEESHCITYKQKDAVSGGHSFPHKNALLIDILSRRSLAHFEEFVKCLVKTEQHKVLKLFPELEGDRADQRLSSDELHKFIVHSRQLLIDTINPSPGFLDLLEGSKCITYQQKQMVNAAHSIPHSSAMLVDLMSQWSVADFKACVSCLKETEQTQAAKLCTEVLSKL